MSDILAAMDPGIIPDPNRWLDGGPLPTVVPEANAAAFAGMAAETGLVSVQLEDGRIVPYAEWGGQS